MRIARILAGSDEIEASVVPAKAGTQGLRLDSCFRRNDERSCCRGSSRRPFRAYTDIILGNHSGNTGPAGTPAPTNFTYIREWKIHHRSLRSRGTRPFPVDREG